MSSEEKISPEEFDKELDSLLAGTTEKKPKNPKRKKINNRRRHCHPQESSASNSCPAEKTWSPLWTL